MPERPNTVNVVVVDDSVVVRRLLVGVLESDPRVKVVATSGNGRLGADTVLRLKPDVVVMDIEMPVMNGIEAVRAIREHDRRTPVIMFSTLTERGARSTFEALDAGATDYVTKPGQAGAVGSGLESVRIELLPKVLALGQRSRGPVAPPPARGLLAARATPAATGSTPPPSAITTLTNRLRTVRRRPALIVIGSSTGGPEALSRVIGALPADYQVPVVIVQHMPAEFTPLLAERLDRSCAVTVRHATDRIPLVPGEVVLARGGQHLEVVRDGTALVGRLSNAAAENFCRPAVDVLFRSVTFMARDVLAVVLTGMGADGTDGAKVLTAAGSRVWAQDEASSVVWGMPGSLVRAGLADEVMPLVDVGPALVAAAGPPPLPKRLAAAAATGIGVRRG